MANLEGIKVIAKTSKLSSIGKLLIFIWENKVHVITAILLLMTFFPAIVDSINQRSPIPFYTGVVQKIGASGVTEGNTADTILKNNCTFPANDITAPPITNHQPGFFGFFANIWNSIIEFFKFAWFYIAFYWSKFAFFITDIFEPFWFVYYTGLIIYKGFRLQEDSRILRALTWSFVIVFIIFNVVSGVVDAHLSVDSLSGRQYEEKVLQPATGYYKIGAVLIDMIKIKFGNGVCPIASDS